jgi:UDP-N-acetylmuramate dehydrogenase
LFRRKKDTIELLREITGHVFFDEPMINHTSFRIGGPADFLIIPNNLEDLKHILKFADYKKAGVYVIGNGTNLLVRDCGIRGIVTKIASPFNDITIRGEKIITGAGSQLSNLLKTAIERSLTGLEFVAGIPGTVGGAIAMNASSHFGSVSNVVDRVTAMDFSGSVHTLSNEECEFGYKKSVFQYENMIILRATIILKKGEKARIQEKVKQIMKRRKKTQPIDKLSAGCIFRNPKGYSAAKLIESAGLRGKKINDAQISTIHSNFIINLGNATARDVLALVDLVQREVAKKFGVFLNPEVNIIPKTNNAL